MAIMSLGSQLHVDISCHLEIKLLALFYTGFTRVYVHCRQLLFGHRQALAEQLRGETELAMALHLACVLMVQVYTGNMVHAPGRCVPQLVAFLKAHVLPEQHATLLTCQGELPLLGYSFGFLVESVEIISTMFLELWAKLESMHRCKVFKNKME